MTRLSAIWPPAQPPLGETFQDQIKPLPVKNEQFERRVTPVGENEQCSQQRVFTQLPAAQSD
jgi:hypothetical protein